MKFTKAIVRRTGQSMINGLTSANLGQPDFDLATKQHNAYIDALIQCGLEVTILDADENFPDSTFVEDAALLTPHCAIITRPGAQSRRGEVDTIKEAVSKHCNNIETIKADGTIEAGDIMMVGSHFYIGLSDRTNQSGADQMITHLNKYNLTGETVVMSEMLHLKSGLAYLDNNNLLIAGEFVSNQQFDKFNKIIIDKNETYSANAIWINEYILIADGFEKTKQAVESAGYKTIILNMSEFQKLDGGLSCLSLRF